MSVRAVIASLLSGLLALAPAAAADTGKAPASQGKPFAQRIDRSRAGTPAPPSLFATRDGKRAKVADFRGPVLVNLWATWCAPCLAELPDLDRLAAAQSGRLTVLAISQDMAGWRAVDRFWTRAGLKTLAPRLDAAGDYAQAVGAAGLPVSIYYVRGREVWRLNGPAKWDSAEVAAQLR